MEQIKRKLWLLGGFVLVFVGAVFVILPGPAFIFLPLGLAMLSREYNWARVWLRKVQKMMNSSAKKLDALFAKRWRR